MKTLGRKLDTNLKRDELRRDEGGVIIFLYQSLSCIQ